MSGLPDRYFPARESLSQALLCEFCSDVTVDVRQLRGVFVTECIWMALFAFVNYELSTNSELASSRTPTLWSTCEGQGLPGPGAGLSPLCTYHFPSL